MTLTSRGQDRHRVRNLPVHLLQRIGSAVDLVKDLAVLDKEHSSRVGRRPDAVGHHKDRLPFLIDPVKKLQKLSGSPGVQSTCRLICQKKLRLGDQGSGCRCPLFLASGDLVGVFVQKTLDLQFFRQGL